MPAKTLIGLLLGLSLLACSAKPELPPAQPLAASAEQLAQISKLAKGDLSVEIIPRQEWQLGQASVTVRIVRPQGDGPWPLLLFSHGFASDIDQYDAVLKHWASHGYISVAPYHRDGGGLPRALINSLRYGKDGLIQQRLDDFTLILANLNKLDDLQAGLGQAVDLQRIIASGHSFGAFTAQQLGGALAIDPNSDLRIGGADPRILAVVAISPPGNMFGLINAASWRSLRVPMLVTTGTWDVDGHFVTEWRQHALSYEEAPAGHNWLLVTQGADHYLGHLICRLDRDEPAQHNALQMLNAVSTSFLTAALNMQLDSLPLLNSALLDEATKGFSRLSRR